jgi:tetratricopeptide (TPR) repeat protein
VNVLSPPADSSQEILGGTRSSSNLQRHLSKYLPPSRHGLVLVTSRTRPAAIQIVEENEIILVKAMDFAAAHSLVYGKLGEVDAADDDVAKLVMALDYMPLALVQAASYIQKRSPRCSVQQYLNDYQQSDASKSSLLNQEAGTLRRDEEASNSVILTWQISFDHVRQTRRSAADLLALMSFFDGQGVHKSLLYNYTTTKPKDGNVNEMKSQKEYWSNNGFGNGGFEDDILTLRDYSFITVTSDADTFEMHSLVQLAMRKWLQSQDQLEESRDQFVFNLCLEFPHGDSWNRSKCQALFPHARVAAAQRPGDKDLLVSWALLLNSAARYALERGDPDEAVHMSTMSMNARKDLFGERDERTLRSMSMIGVAKGYSKEWKEAESIHRYILVQRQELLGPDHPETLASVLNLAVVLPSQGKWEDAEAILGEQLGSLGLHNPRAVKVMIMLAILLNKQRKYKEAGVLGAHALKFCEAELGPQHPATVSSFETLHKTADSLKRLENYERSLTFFEILHSSSQRIYGRDHQMSFQTMDDVAYNLDQVGRYNESLATYKKVYNAYQTIHGQDHPQTLEVMVPIAKLLMKLAQ